MERERGGTCGLVAVTFDRWPAIEADFQEHYGVDLGVALWDGEMSVRRYEVLLRGLPAHARYRLPENGGWTRVDHRQTDTAELLHLIYRQLVAMAGGRPPSPLRYPRPTQKPKAVSPRDFIRRMLRGR